MSNRVAEVLAKNVAALMAAEGWTQETLAAKSGVAQRTISNLLNPGAVQSPLISSAEAVAAAFGVELWHLLIPNLPDDLLKNTSIPKLVDAYKEASPEGRTHTLRVAEAEIYYKRASNHD